MSKPKTVTVCSACHSASCWEGFLMCEDARTAGTIEMPIPEAPTPEPHEHEGEKALRTIRELSEGAVDDCTHARSECIAATLSTPPCGSYGPVACDSCVRDAVHDAYYSGYQAGLKQGTQRAEQIVERLIEVAGWRKPDTKREAREQAGELAAFRVALASLRSEPADPTEPSDRKEPA